MAFGRLERTPTDPPLSDINVTPLVDVMLVLVVIFILAAPLLASTIRLDLPSALGARPGVPSSALVVVLDRSGQVFVQDQPVPESQLSQRLRQEAAQRPDVEIHLRADAAVPYGRVAEVIGLAQAAGLQRIGFVVEPPALP